VSIQACLDALKAGHVVAFPTDTFFALSCDPLSDPALTLLRQLKAIGPARPLPLLIPPGFDCTRIGCVLNPRAQLLAREFWPGKLTLVVPCEGPLGSRVGRKTDCAVGLRVPEGEWLSDLLRAFDGPLVGTSANRTGQSPAATVEEVRRYFTPDQVTAFAGVAPGGAPSTVISVTGPEPEVEREGAIPIALLRHTWEQGRVA
jgi:L-threonylcarbamoyladenylate synthase